MYKITLYLMVDRSDRSSRPEVFLRKSVLKICSKFTGEHPCRSGISVKLFCNSIEIARRHGCSLVNLMHILRTPFLKNTSGRLLTKWAATIMAKISALSVLEESCFHYGENNVCFYIRGEEHHLHYTQNYLPFVPFVVFPLWQKLRLF